MITPEQASVLAHTSSNGRYVTGDARVLAMAREGLLKDFGAQALAGGMHYLTLTVKGREALMEWRAGQPNHAHQKKRRRSRAFECWRIHQDIGYDFGFPQFLREIWPWVKHRA